MRIVMDIGGTNMRVAAVVHGVLGNIKKVPTPENPVEGIMRAVALARECAGADEITAVTGCVAGSVSEEGVISDARNLRAWEGTNIVQDFSNNLGVPVRVVNDAALVGLGEATTGAGKGSLSLAYITVSTGVGGGWIVDGKIATPEGMQRIIIDGTDLEDLVSGTAVKNKFGISPKDLDSVGERNRLADILAEGLRIVTLRWSPDTIVLGGSMIVGVNPIPIPRVQEKLNKLLNIYSKVPAIKMAELGDNGGLWGGVALFKQES